MTATPVKQDYEIRAGLAEVMAFDVVGISIITDSARATDDINALWERFFTESIGQKIPGKTDDAIYAVYSDYQGDHEAPYRLTIGYRIAKNNTPPPTGGREGVGGQTTLHHVTVKPGQYALMSAAGKQPTALIETWEAIWSSDLSRAYQTDFEVYGPRFFETGVNEVLIHVGVKS
ncbi:MAG: effector binding domain-containing protein [Rhodospirillales bacterium]|nr:effector binding domain-containing protein [Rhodospirillales bacterium]